MRQSKKPMNSNEVSARKDDVSQICIDAAIALISKEGYAALSIEAIAKTTGIAKTTIYRRWKSKGELVLDSLLADGEKFIKPTDSGSIRKDLESFAAQTFDLITKHNLGSSLIAVIIEAQINKDFAERLRVRLIEKRRQALREVIERGKAGGELRADCDTEIALDIIYGVFWYRLLMNHAPLSKKSAKMLIKQILRGIEQ